MGPRPPALVLGAYITALAVVRAFGRAGHPVYVAGRNTATVSRSRWYRRVPGDDLAETDSGEVLGAYLRTLPFDRTVLFPCSDRWTLAVAALPPDVSRSHLQTVASLDVVRTLVDKELFAEAACRLGVRAPRVLRPAELETIAADQLQDFFVKPTRSQAFSERFGVKALRLESRAQATELLSRLAAEQIDVLLQEFIPGPPTAHVFLDGYVDRTGVMRACLARRRLRMYPRPFGNSTLSVTIPAAEVNGAVEALRQLFNGLGYVGLFDAEFKLDARDGCFKILEVNARPWWQLDLAGASGLDVCTMAYRDALGEPVATVDRYRIGTTWVHPIPDLTAWWTGRALGDFTGGWPPRAWFTGSNAAFSWDDPKPAVDEILRLVRRVLGRGR